MAIRAKRHEEKLKNKLIRAGNDILYFIRQFMTFVTFLAMPVLLVWALVLTIMQAPFMSILSVCVMLVVCIVVNAVL